MKLYSFYISHFCEKARWFLDHKGLKYEEIFWVPGTNILKAKRRKLKKTFVPILDDKGAVTQGSDYILRYIEETYPEKPLIPKGLEDEVVQWDNRLSYELGKNLRKVGYFYLLPDRPNIIELMTKKNSSLWKLPFRLFYPLLEKELRRTYQIYRPQVEESKKVLLKYFDELDRHFENNQYLCGDQLTAADITLASMVAPFVRPKNHFVDWPEKLLPEAEEFFQEHESRPILSWVDNMYQQHRY